MHFIGQICPYCNEELKETDEIAVCPICGTPHHKKCYKENKQCANTSLHADGFEWRAKVEAKTDSTPEVDPNICSVCGADISNDDTFCHKCGNKLNSKLGPQMNSGFRAPEIDTGETIDNVPVKYYIAYLGKNKSLPMVMSFRRQDIKNTKTGFAPAAFISPILFFTYYKVWKWAIASFILQVLGNIPLAILTYMEAYSVKSFFNYSLAQMTQFSNIASILLILYYIICAIYGNYIVRMNSNKKIRRLMETTDNEEQLIAVLLKKGCPSVLVYVFLGIIALAYAILMFI